MGQGGSGLQKGVVVPVGWYVIWRRWGSDIAMGGIGMLEGYWRVLG